MGLGLAAGVMMAASLVHAAGDAVVDSVELNGEKVWKTNAIPPELAGTYLYEKQGEPIIKLNADGTGIFQPHMQPGIPIQYWLLSDEKGELVKESGGANYRYTLVLRYGEGGGGNYPAGDYASWYWTMDATYSGCAIILGERFKC